MKKYIIHDDKRTTHYCIELNNITEVRHWIVNHLNLSIHWNIKEQGVFNNENNETNN